LVKVLYATDGGVPARQAGALFERVAARDKTEVVVATVTGPWGPGDEGGPADASFPVNEAASRLRAAGFEAATRIEDGSPGEVILQIIDEGRFDLVLTGAGNRSRLDRLLLGSVSTKVRHAGSVSAMIVHRFRGGSSPVRVLFGTDGSEDSHLALQQMIALFDPVDCDVRVLSVAEHLMPQVTFPIPRAAFATSGPTPELEQEWIDAARIPADDAAAKLRAAGFASEVRAVLGSPTARLMAEADDMQADLVVVGSRGLGAIGRVAVGSVSDHVVREAAAALVARRKSAGSS
jgi:nucleotide-binding universal stress UspA family protein